MPETTPNPGPNQTKSYFLRLYGNFGFQFLMLMTSAYLGVKGALWQLMTTAQQPYYQRYMGVTGELFQTYGTASGTPWAMKAVLGVLSDAYPLFGYHKASYLVLASILGTTALVLLASIPLGNNLGPLAAALFFVAELDVATVDLLCEGKYTELMIKNPNAGADIVTWVNGLQTAGTLFAALLIGPLVDGFSPRAAFIICAVLAVQAVIPVWLRYLPEPFVPIPQRRLRSDRLAAFPNLFTLAVVMALLALAMAWVTLSLPPLMQLVYALLASGVLCALAFRWLPAQLAKANLYMFLTQALYLHLNGATDYFFTAGPECVYHGPYFDYTYYLTFTQVVGSLAQGLGLVVFQVLLSQQTFRRAFWLTTLVKVLASFLDVVIVERWNVKFLHIPDRWMYLFGDAMIFNVCQMLDWMPSIVLTAKVCPQGLEATVYALLAGFQNFGQNVARIVGICLMQALSIHTVPPCNFKRLGLALVIGHMVLPLFAVPFTFFLVPNAHMTDNLFAEEANWQPASPTSDSSAEEDVPQPADPAKPEQEMSSLLSPDPLTR